MVGIGRAASLGLLVRNSEVLQVASTLDVVVLDKTGTLTMGKPEVKQVNRLTEDQLGLVLDLEQQSAHPIAQAIVTKCLARGIVPATLSSFREHPGGGVIADHDGTRLILGTPNFLMEQGISGVPEINDIGTVVALAVGPAYVGHFDLTDTVRPDAPQIIQSLLALGVTPGDVDRRSIGNSRSRGD